MNPKNTYIALGVVFVASIAAAILLPVAEMIRVLAAVPAIASLCAALLQIFRDRIAHDRTLLVLEAQNTFSIGATSHMANVAFDKYALFCEEYVEEMFQTLRTLNRDGPRQTALPHASKLLEIRQKSALWLTPEVEAELDRFEIAIRKIGANAWLLEQAPGDPAAISEMYSLFAEVLGFEKWDNKQITGELTLATVTKRLRHVLGTDELSLIRGSLVERSLRHIRSSD